MSTLLLAMKWYGEYPKLGKTIRRDTMLLFDKESDYSRISHITGMLEMEGLISIDLLQRCTANTRIYR